MLQAQYSQGVTSIDGRRHALTACSSRYQLHSSNRNSPHLVSTSKPALAMLRYPSHLVGSLRTCNRTGHSLRTLASSTTQSNPSPSHQPTPNQILKKLAYITGGIVLLAGSVAAPAPYLLSQPSGLNTAVSVANAVAAPADVHLAVGSFSGGWTTPVVIQNLQIKRGRKPENDTASATTSSSATSSSHRDSSEGRNKQPTNNQQQREQQAGQGQVLVDIGSIKTTTGLWPLLTGSQPSNVLIKNVNVWGVPEPNGGGFALENAAEKLGLSAPKHDMDLIPNGDINNDISSPGSVNVTSSHTTIHIDDDEGRRVGGKEERSVDVCTAQVGFTAEYCLRNIRVSVLDASATVTEELRDVLGDNLHVEALSGSQIIQEESDPADDVTWSHTSNKPSSIHLPAWAGKLKEPLSVRVDSSCVSAKLAGWETSKGYKYLIKPVEGSLQLTPQNAKAVLQRLNPFLSGIVSIQGDTVLQGDVTPAGSLWPAQQINIRTAPLHVSLGRGSTLQSTLSILSLADSRFSGTASSLEIRLTPLCVTLTGSGGQDIIAQRTDLQITVTGGGSRFRSTNTNTSKGSLPLTVTTWGRSSIAKQGSINMTLAIPGSTLESIGIQGVEPEEGLVVHVKGSMEAPVLDVSEASQALAMLLMQQHAQQAMNVTNLVPSWMAAELSSGVERSLRGVIVQLPELPAVVQSAKV